MADPELEAKRQRAPAWKIECATCKSWKWAGEAGIVRLGARSKGKSTFGWCRSCRFLRRFRIYRDPEAWERRNDA